MRRPTKTYTSRPPASARAARRAWDHFARSRASKARPLVELFYSPNYRGYGPHWCCEIGMVETDTMRWAFSKEDLAYATAASTLAALISDTKDGGGERG